MNCLTKYVESLGYPGPRKEIRGCHDSTKKGLLPRPRPSSPWNIYGIQSPYLALGSQKIGCWLSISRYSSQNVFSMPCQALVSHTWWPPSNISGLFDTRYSIQLVIDTIGQWIGILFRGFRFCTRITQLSILTGTVRSPALCIKRWMFLQAFFLELLMADSFPKRSLRS